MNFNLRDIGSKLSTRGWITVGAAALVGVLFVYLLMSFASAPSYTSLVAGDSPTQAGKVTTALSAAGINYQLLNGGTAVSVQSSQLGQARDLLSAQGLLTDAPSSLQQLLGPSSLGATSLQQQEQVTSATEQQLDQTIETMNGINSAQVQLAIPNPTDSLFTNTNTQTSASVLLNTNGALSPTAVKAIAQEVSGSVTGLDINRVTVTDQNGDLLWPDGSASGASTLTAAQSADNAYSTQQAEQADAYLAATVGPGMALVHVAAVLNPNQQTVSSVQYAKGKGVPLTQSVTTQSLTGTGASPVATGNTATQIPTVAGSTTSGNSNYRSNASNTTYGASKTVTQQTLMPGTLTRQTISVLVNKSVPASEVPAIRSAVENSLGFVPSRDTISIATVAFPKALPATAAASSTTSMLGQVKYVVIGLGALMFLFFMRRGLRRTESEPFAGTPTWLSELEAPRSLAELEGGSQMGELEAGSGNITRLRSPVNVAKQQVEELVDRDPQRVASQVRQWMTED